MGLHGMVRSVIVSTNLLIIVVANSFFSDHMLKTGLPRVNYCRCVGGIVALLLKSCPLE